MLQCPTCQATVKPEERFCGNCGGRLAPQAPPAAAAGQPPTAPHASGKETIVLPALDIGATPIEPAIRPANDATIIAGTPPPLIAPPGAGELYSSIPPTTPLIPPASTPPSGGVYPNASLPSGASAPPQKSGGNIWKIIGIIGGISLLACIALSAGVYFVVIRPAITAGQNGLATVSAGISTAVSDPTLQAIAAPPTFIAEEQPTPADTQPTAAEEQPTPAAGGGSVLYRQTFDKDGSDFAEDETENAIYKFVDGAYSVSAKQPNLIIWQTIKGDYANAAISLDATIDGPAKSAAGLIFHYQDDKNFYFFTITGDSRYSLDVYEDDKLTTLIDWIESAAIKPAGEINHLRVETVGDTIRLYANDELLDEISDGTLSRGKAAIALNTFDDAKLTVVFDNLIIKSIK